MYLPEWLRNLNPWRARLKKTRSDNMRCSCCRRNIHKGERFIIDAAHHRDCSDPKMNGQGRLFEAVPLGDIAPAAKLINGEVVIIAPGASMGNELIGEEGVDENSKG
jgi:hypothetical protein